MFGKFIKNFFTATVVGLFLVLGINYFVDPFGIYPFTPIKGINLLKIKTASRMAIAMRMIRYQPKMVALGTSRVAIGFEGDVLKNYSEDDSYFNAGFAGASFDEMYAYFEHALYVQPNLKTIILGIDLFSFGENRNPQVDFNHERLQRNDFVLKDVKHSLISFKSLWSSFECVCRNMFDLEIPNEIHQIGEENLFNLMLNAKDTYQNYALDQEKINKFRNIVDICKAGSIELKVFVCPIKAKYWEFYCTNGLWPHVENLKRQLCFIHPVWDFSGYNPITTESFDSNGVALYQDCSHFTTFTGELLLKRIFGHPSPIDSIGFLLTPETVEKSFKQILSQRDAWNFSNGK